MPEPSPRASRKSSFFRICSIQSANSLSIDRQTHSGLNAPRLRAETHDASLSIVRNQYMYAPASAHTSLRQTNSPNLVHIILLFWFYAWRNHHVFHSFASTSANAVQFFSCVFIFAASIVNCSRAAFTLHWVNVANGEIYLIRIRNSYFAFMSSSVCWHATQYLTEYHCERVRSHLPSPRQQRNGDSGGGNFGAIGILMDFIVRHFCVVQHKLRGRTLKTQRLSIRFIY